MTNTSRIDILKVKHWQLVLLLFALVIPFAMAATHLGYSVPGLWWVSEIVPLAILLAYPMMTWARLNRVLAKEARYERANEKFVVAAAVAFMIIPAIVPSTTNTPLGIAESLSFLCLWAFICSRPAKQLKSIELKRNAGVWEYAADTFNFMMWPLGVFWVQSRINEIPEKRIVITE